MGKGASIDAVPLATLTGRFEFASTDGNRTIIPGSIDYGTNYHVWDNDVFDTVRLGTIDTTTQSIRNDSAGLSFNLPSASKVKCVFNHRPFDVNSTGASAKIQIWSIASMPGGRTNGSWTLRGESDFTTGTDTNTWTQASVTTTSAIPANSLVLFTLGLNNLSITRPLYIPFQATLLMED